MGFFDTFPASCKPPTVWAKVFLIVSHKCAAMERDVDPDKDNLPQT